MYDNEFKTKKNVIGTKDKLNRNIHMWSMLDFNFNYINMRSYKKCWFFLGCVLIGRREKEFQIAVKASPTCKQIFDGWGWGWGGEGKSLSFFPLSSESLPAGWSESFSFNRRSQKTWVDDLILVSWSKENRTQWQSYMQLMIRCLKGVRGSK